MVYAYGQRPGGMYLSYAAYSAYGTNFLIWLMADYLPSYLYAKFRDPNNNGADSNGSFEMPKIDTKFMTDFISANIPKNSMAFEICNNYIQANDNSYDYIIKNMAVLLKHTLNIEEYPITKVHTEVLQDKNRIFAKYGLDHADLKANKIFLPQSDVRSMCAQINHIFIELQEELKKEITLENYIKCNGDDKSYNLINPDIAVSVLS